MIGLLAQAEVLLYERAYDSAWSKEGEMIKHEILEADGILLLEPQSALAAEDFHALSSEVNAYLKDHADLRGILIHARSFPGWDSYAAFVEHLRFLREVHTKVERV